MEDYRNRMKEVVQIGKSIKVEQQCEFSARLKTTSKPRWDN